MEMKYFISCQITLILLFMACSSTNGLEWCVAQVSAPNDKLQAFIDFACSKVDCAPIRAGGNCFDPNTLQNHGSYALDAYYRKTGQCDTAIATPAVTDPSFGGCHYP